MTTPTPHNLAPVLTPECARPRRRSWRRLASGLLATLVGVLLLLQALSLPAYEQRIVPFSPSCRSWQSSSDLWCKRPEFRLVDGGWSTASDFDYRVVAASQARAVWVMLAGLILLLPALVGLFAPGRARAAGLSGIVLNGAAVVTSVSWLAPILGANLGG
jgi:hypothetical protein